ncbi:MAG: hypothetical protein U5L10_04365 [Candidatus Moranbacteria bacterium]|nr:hypothetical protein [Candidatus Moranbacteria bacterium]
MTKTQIELFALDGIISPLMHLIGGARETRKNLPFGPEVPNMKKAGEEHYLSQW